MEVHFTYNTHKKSRIVFCFLLFLLFICCNVNYYGLYYNSFMEIYISYKLQSIICRLHSNCMDSDRIISDSSTYNTICYIDQDRKELDVVHLLYIGQIKIAKFWTTYKSVKCTKGCLICLVSCDKCSINVVFHDSQLEDALFFLIDQCFESLVAHSP